MAVSPNPVYLHQVNLTTLPCYCSRQIHTSAHLGRQEIDKDQDGQDSRAGCVHEPARSELSALPTFNPLLNFASQGVVYLGTEWANNPVIRSDIKVSHFLDSVGGYRYRERLDRLLDLLDVDLDWKMHQISDGERRRVQLCMGLMGHWDVLLLDEVTVDLDVLVRSELLAFLVQESEERGATIVYATHIFDGLQAFPTHICHLQLGKTPQPLLPWPLPVSQSPLKPDEQKGVMTEHSDLLGIALEWLKEDRTIRRKLEKERGLVARGARRNEVRYRFRDY